MGFTLTERTKTTIGIAGTIVVVGVGSTWTIKDALSKIESKFALTDARIEALEKGQYTLAAASEQALRFAIENPGMKMPDPRQPSQVIEVRSVRKDPPVDK